MMKGDELRKIISATEIVNSNLNLKDVLNNIVSVALELTDSDRGTIYLVDKEKKEIRSVIATGIDSMEIKLKLGEGLAGYVAESGETVNIKNAETDIRFNPSFDSLTGYKTKSMICFPIKNKENETIGVLQLLNNHSGEFTDSDEYFLKALSIHAAIAINNALMMKKQIESNEELKKAKHEVEKFAMLRSHFLTQMSHEIRTPLNIILGGLEYLRLKSEDSQTGDLQGVFEMLENGSSRITRTIDSIIEMSRIKSGDYELHPEIINLEQDIIFPIIDNLEPSAKKKGITLTYTTMTSQKLITKDKFMLYQIFLEIISNAVKFTEQGGVDITQYTNSEDKLAVSIQDTGIGIAPEFIEQIFEPFIQEQMGLSRKYEGNGLALALVKKYAELNDITITINSNKNVGAEFIIIFNSI